jgi:hypothetical protein
MKLLFYFLRVYPHRLWCFGAFFGPLTIFGPIQISRFWALSKGYSPWISVFRVIFWTSEDFYPVIKFHIFWPFLNGEAHRFWCFEAFFGPVRIFKPFQSFTFLPIFKGYSPHILVFQGYFLDRWGFLSRFKVSICWAIFKGYSPQISVFQAIFLGTTIKSLTFVKDAIGRSQYFLAPRGLVLGSYDG